MEYITHKMLEDMVLDPNTALKNLLEYVKGPNKGPVSRVQCICDVVETHTASSFDIANIIHTSAVNAGLLNAISVINFNLGHGTQKMYMAFPLVRFTHTWSVCRFRSLEQPTGRFLDHGSESLPDTAIKEYTLLADDFKTKFADMEPTSSMYLLDSNDIGLDLWDGLVERRWLKIDIAEALEKFMYNRINIHKDHATVEIMTETVYKNK